ncbi:MAG: site-specific integrase [Proteobacteria bacterium]|nr:site-specific integrase [Pseudomonadota bacterium]
MAIDTTRLPREFVSARELFLHYLITEKRFAENTIKAYEADIDLFLHFFGKTQKQHPCSRSRLHTSTAFWNNAGPGRFPIAVTPEGCRH